MAIVWARESPKGRSCSGKYLEGASYKREFLVRTDSPDTSMVDISNAPGIALTDPYPDDPTAFMQSFDIKATDDSGLLYSVTFSYEKTNPEETNNDNGNGNGQPGSLDFRPPVWGGSSSVVTGPIFEDKGGNVITNTAGDPLEGLEAERAEERLTKTEYYSSHTEWMADAKRYTNAINSEPWNGGDRLTWKCQGCSKKLNIENRDGVYVIYWEVTWEFAYNPNDWCLKPWNIGFHQLLKENGQPCETIAENCPKREAIKGEDGKGVRQPVALDDSGAAKPAGQKPDALRFHIYNEEDFGAKFGQVYTPSVT